MDQSQLVKLINIASIPTVLLLFFLEMQSFFVELKAIHAIHQQQTLILERIQERLEVHCKTHD
jgi:hypothetical protein